MKKITTFSFSIFAFLLALFFVSCEKEIDSRDLSHLQQGPYYSAEDWSVISASLNLPDLPYDYFGITNSFKTNAIPTLGRVLFYDKNLSKDRSVSCASCHKQELAFSDDVAFSRGIENRQTDRNSLALGSFEDFQSSYGAPIFKQDGRFFWDERVGTLHEQMEQTIPNAKEMGLGLDELHERLRDIDYVKVLYRKAFSSEIITMDNILLSISQFINSISSRNSPFDREFGFGFSVEVSEPFPGFTPQENLGKELFLEKCGHCHAFSLSMTLANQFQNTKTSANNGLDKNYSDRGVGAITNNPEDYGVFKIPGLRNIELTGPYMHDGRFETLEEVVEFYSSGVQLHDNLDERLTNLDGTPHRTNFTEEEKAAVVAFLKTLTDETITKEVRWSDPFK